MLRILGAYVYTGCDQVEKFSSITKTRALAEYFDFPTDLVHGLITRSTNSLTMYQKELPGTPISSTERRSEAEMLSARC